MKEFRERVSSNDGSYFLLIYNGTPIDLTEDESREIDRRIRLFMDNRSIQNDLLKCVAFLRTIMIDFDETYIYLKYYSKTQEERVEYRDKKLSLYESTIQNSDKKNDKKTINFNKDNGYATISGYGKNESDAARARVEELKTVGPIGVGNQEIKLIDCYHYFYNMHPNFTGSQTNDLCQCMNLILKRFNIDILNVDDYVYDPEKEIAYSETITDMVHDLFPYGQITISGKSQDFTEEEIEKIKLIGSKVCNSINDMNRVRGLIRIASLLNTDESKLSGSNLELVKRLREIETKK